MDDYRKALTVWYNHTKRDLPWRELKEPYPIWVSEVILQQTRVQQGLEYYFNFMQKYPDIESLASAPEEEVLKTWQGLGYYSRARNMQHAAKTIQREHGGIFPADYNSIKNLKGIGEYTAAAIASIAFDLPYAVVDGNVYRVLSRLFGVKTPVDSSTGKKEFYALAQMLLDRKNPGEFNQALMELGALQCLPAQPLCPGCPLSAKCHAYINQTTADYPVKSKQVKQKVRYFNYLFIHDHIRLFLEKRGDRDIWRNMYQFPLIETLQRAEPEELIGGPAWQAILGNQQFTLEAIYPEKVHLLTHQRLHIRFYSVRGEGIRASDRLISIPLERISGYPVPKPIAFFLSEVGH